MSVGPLPFTDEAANARMTEQGYAVLASQLNPDTLSEMMGLYRGVLDEVGSNPTGKFFPSMTITRPHLRARLWDGVRELTSSTVEPLLAPGTSELIGGSFVSKPGSPNGTRNPHQDPSTFDETRHAAFSLWIPLSDSTTDNGTLFVLPASHRMGNHVRPPDVDSLDEEVSATAIAESIPVELDAGQILAVDSALVHHSPPNQSGQERVAAICAIQPASAELRYVRSDHGAPSGTAAIYETGVELYRSGNLVEPDLDAARLIDRAPYRPAAMADLRRSCGMR